MWAGTWLYLKPSASLGRQDDCPSACPDVLVLILTGASELHREMKKMVRTFLAVGLALIFSSCSFGNQEASSGCGTLLPA